MVKYSVIIAVLVFVSCTIRPPDVNVTSEKTALENQLFGENWDLTEKQLTTAAVWAAMQESSANDSQSNEESKISTQYEKSELVLAQIRRRSMQPYIDQLKRQKLIGEANDGYLRIVESNINSADEIQSIVNAENSDREIIWKSYAETKGAYTDDDLFAIQRNFAEIASNLSPTGTMIQNFQNEWVEK